MLVCKLCYTLATRAVVVVICDKDYHQGTFRDTLDRSSFESASSNFFSTRAAEPLPEGLTIPNSMR